MWSFSRSIINLGVNKLMIINVVIKHTVKVSGLTPEIKIQNNPKKFNLDQKLHK